jgi:hypothetical protein
VLRKARGLEAARTRAPCEGHQAVLSIETDVREQPSLPMLRRLAKVLGVALTELLR